MPSQERAERTRRSLIVAAATALDESAVEVLGGDALPGLDAISRAAGVSKGALYYHFRSKGELIEAVRAEARCELRRLTAECVAAHGPGAGLDAVVDVAVAVAGLLDRDPVCRSGVRLDGVEGFALAAGDGPPEWMAPIGALLASAADRGELREGVVPEEAAMALTAMAAGVLLICERNAGVSRTEMVARLWGAVLPGLAAPPADGCPFLAADCGAVPADLGN
ncbi:TetR/AcrR family transcriptional regulator [Kitasatospora sp. NPDC085895]|uniref:TetR/AcrR family transcriptional regulator n=1 Tax=Kitasatospora sp. NPDC085895 TaxID=3155057 RepID=UPI00344DEDDD